MLNSQAKHPPCRKCGGWHMEPNKETGRVVCASCGWVDPNARYHATAESFIEAVMEQVGKTVDPEVDGLLDKVIEQSISDDTPIDKWADKLARDFAKQPEDGADE